MSQLAVKNVYMVKKKKKTNLKCKVGRGTMHVLQGM